ncbi:juvenile hormone esterase-like isoform X2 [Aricia agestis]|uniref:juvenile hormone esterase-like isoform X2 n=1 Tax=Aricia agestis TaxID=91739 RepID=UPI001C207ADB|nr:juvenile hormone esterase-like isoform X2 [Aricia agestis]
MVKVHVEQGWLEGEMLPLVTLDGFYYSFKGIPYAQPPLGERRFKEPKPPTKWEGVRQATSHGPICSQKDLFSGKIVEGGSEDCLYLNVYSPDLTPSKPLAVMVFIHGGGLISGSGNSEMYGPDFLVRDNVIFVTLNYRVGIIGFLCLDIPEVPGNAGLKDQVAALKWVNRNIAKFGGDPTNVTLFGDSVGSACVALHTLSPMSKDLFRKAIIMSDSPFSDITLPFFPQKRALALGSKLGCTTNDPTALFSFLKEMPIDEMLESNACILGLEENMSFFKMCHLVPVVEKDLGQNGFLTEDPVRIFLSGNVNVDDIIAGYTADESIAGLAIYGDSLLAKYKKYPELFVPRSMTYEKSPKEVLRLAEKIIDYYFDGKSLNNINFTKYLSDITFKYHIHKLLGLFMNTNAKCYFYQFSGYTERNIFGNQKEKHNITGAAHFDDLMYLFHSKIYDLPIVSANDQSCKVIRNICMLFTNFAKSGNPTPDSSLGVLWPEYDEENKTCLDIAEDLTLKRSLDTDAVQFWDKIYQESGKSYGSYT